MRCTSKVSILFLAVFSLLLSGCGREIENAYDVNTTISAYTFKNDYGENTAPAFARDICVVNGDIIEGVDLSRSEASGLFDLTDKRTLLAKNANERLNPASLTKTMTAMIALKYGRLEDVLIASKNVVLTESGAQMIPLHEGDRMTLEEALHALLLYSANDAAVMVAEYISGSVEEFANLMNKEALALGATNTHFVNPHGLTAEEHYTTVYDLYLIFKEAVKYEKFIEIINKDSYDLTYTDMSGASKSLSIKNTNAYLSGSREMPQGIRVIGGKTGTTDAAGSCLIILSYDENQRPYISCVLKADDREGLYDQMSWLLSSISRLTGQ